MRNRAVETERVRAVIRSACRTLGDVRTTRPAFAAPLPGLDEDLAVLLRDATGMFCRSVNEVQGGLRDSRWSPDLADLLLSHPEQCDEILARVESGHLPASLEACPTPRRELANLV